MLPWPWHRPVATVLIPPLAWELPYAVGIALKYIYIYKIVLKKAFSFYFYVKLNVEFPDGSAS